jgi:lysophospholipase L1-like esterase
LRPRLRACHDLSVVRSTHASLALALACGCGEGAATPPREPSSEIAVAPPLTRPDTPPDGAMLLQTPPDGAVAVDTPPPVAPSAALAMPPVGHLTGPGHLEHAFEVLAGLEDGHRHDDVRVLQYGDSHTASDLGVAVFRHALQVRFGEGGRGFVPLGRPWKTFGGDGLHTGMDAEFEPSRVKYAKGSFTGEGGCYGLLGVGIETEHANAKAWTEVSAPASHIELAYAAQPQGGSFDVIIDGSQAGRVATRGAEAKGGFFAFDVTDAPHRVEVRAVGDGDVRIYGMNLDRPSAGVVVDALGINGAQFSTPLRWGEACFAEQVRHVSPDLVVLAYGTNEALEPGLTDAQLERQMVDLLGRVARAQPTASCMILGPPDLARRQRAEKPEKPGKTRKADRTDASSKGADGWTTWPRVTEIVAVEKRVAEAAGCAFYDQMEAMGGAGSMAQWASEADPRGGRDRVHLRRTGYAQLATSFATDLTHAYDEWRAQKGLAPAGVTSASPPTARPGR